MTSTEEDQSRGPRGSGAQASERRIEPIVVVGAGVAGVRFVRRLRRSGHEGPVVLVDAQAGDPYDRPPLSKQVLRGERERPVLLDAAALTGLGVDFRPGRRAIRLNADRRVVTLDDGELAYSAVIIATGARPRRVTGVGGVVLRTFDDAIALRSFANPGVRALVVGAGVVGCEVAASMRQQGVDVHLVDPMPAPMVRVVGPVVATLVTELHRSHGVMVHTGTVVTDSGPRWTALSDGTELAPDLVLEAVGTEPDLDWLADSGLALADGVLCDDRQRTNLTDVYVVGDVAAPHGRRSEHWTAATEHADRALAALLKTDPPPSEPAYWWSDQYGIKLQGIGDVATADMVVLGLSGGNPVALYGRAGHVVGAVGLGAPAALMKLRASVVTSESLALAAAGLSEVAWYPAAGSDAPVELDRKYHDALLSRSYGGAA